MGNVSRAISALHWLILQYSHVEGHSTVFGTGLNYTALRLLGMDADHPVCTKARGTLHRLGALEPPSFISILILCKAGQLPFLLGVNSGCRF